MGGLDAVCRHRVSKSVCVIILLACDVACDVACDPLAFVMCDVCLSALAGLECVVALYG